MDTEWSKIFSTPDPFQAEILKGRLTENDIPCVVVNKQDSMYKPIGDLEVYVPRDMVIKALHYLETDLGGSGEDEKGEKSGS